MKERIKQISTSLLAAVMVFTFMPVLGLGAFESNVYAATAYESNVTIPDQTWTGDDIDLSTVDELSEIYVRETSKPTGSYKTKLVRGVDFTVEADTNQVTNSAHAQFTCIGAFAGDTINDVTFRIVAPTPAPTEYSATIDESDFVYGFGALSDHETTVAQKIKVLADGNRKVSYSPSRNAGRFYVDVTPVVATAASGNAGEKYTVTAKVWGANADADVTVESWTVTISKKNLADATLAATPAITGLTYSASAKTPEPGKVTVDGTDQLTATTDFTITGYDNNVNATTSTKKAYVLVKATDACKNYTGEGKVPFEIGQYVLSSNTDVIVADQVDVVYNGDVQTPDVAARVYFAKTHTAGEIPTEDYKVVAVNPNSTKVGAYEVTVKANEETGNLADGAGVAEVIGYNIKEADLKDVVVTQIKDVTPDTPLSSSMSDFTTYFTVTFGEDALSAGEYKYEFSKTSDLNVGDKVKLTVKPSANSDFTGKNELEFTVVAQPFADTYESSETFEYTGSTIRPSRSQLKELTAVNPKTGEKTPLTTSEYDVDETTFKNNINVGTATVTINGVGSYVGQSATAEFKIVAKDITSQTVNYVTGVSNGAYYEGAVIEGATAKVGGKDLSAEDCVVKAEEITDLNKLTKVVVEGKGNYKGTSAVYTLPTPVDADRVDLSKADEISAEISAGLTDYNKDAIQDAITVKVGNTVVDAAHYTVDNIVVPTGGAVVGAEITFTVKGVPATATDMGTIGSKAGKVTVAKKNIADSDVVVTIEDIPTVTYTYDGNAKEVNSTVTVPDYDNKINGLATTKTTKALTKDTDFTVAYDDNVNAGTVTATIAGKGLYEGSVEKTFVIAKANPTGKFDLKDVPAEKRQFKVGAPTDLSNELELVKSDPSTKYEVSSEDYKFKIDQTPVQTATAVQQGWNWTAQWNPTFKKEIAVTDEARQHGVNLIRVYYSAEFKDSKNYNDANITGFYYYVAERTIASNDEDVEITLGNEGVVEFRNGTISNGIYASQLNATEDPITVKVAGTTLRQGTDYHITYGGTNKIDSERTSEDTEPFVEFEFDDNYNGKARTTFSIVAEVFDINDVKLVKPTVSDSVYKNSPIGVTANYIGDKYTDSEAAARFDVWYTGEGIEEATTTAPTNAGAYTATAIAKEAYGGLTGESVEYTITPKKLTATEFNSLAAGLRATATYPEAPVLAGTNSDLFEVVSYDEYTGEAGKTYKAVAKLKDGGNVTSAKTVELNVAWSKGNTASLDPADFYEIEDQYYTGSDIEPGLKAIEGKNLSVDYATIKYYDNNTKKGNKSAKAFVEVNVPANDPFYTEGKTSGYVVFSIIEDPAETAAKEIAKGAAEFVIGVANEVLDSDEYTFDAKLKVSEKLADLKAVLANNDATSEEINAATNALLDTIFTATEDSSKADATKEAADAAGKAATVTAANGYPADAVSDVAAALKALELTVSSPTSTASDIAAKTDALKAAVELAEAKKAALPITEANGYTASSAKAVADAVKTNDAAKINAAVKAAKKKVANTLTAKGKKIKAKSKKTKKFKAKKAFKVSGAVGKVTYQKVSGNKKITVAENGKIKVKKGLKKGKTYKVKVAVTAAGDGNTFAKTQNVTVKVKVK